METDRPLVHSTAWRRHGGVALVIALVVLAVLSLLGAPFVASMLLRRKQSMRAGAVARLRARVRNAGGLPSGAGPCGVDRRLRLELELPEGVTLLAGEASTVLDHLPGGAASRELEWLFTAPEGSVIRIRACAPLCTDVVREVKL